MGFSDVVTGVYEHCHNLGGIEGLSSKVKFQSGRGIVLKISFINQGISYSVETTLEEDTVEAHVKYYTAKINELLNRED